MTKIYRNYAVLWDMDGVLVDTGAFHFSAWKQTFEKLGIAFNNEVFRKTFGMTNAGILEWISGSKPKPEEVARISQMKETLFREFVRGKADLLPGVRMWLRQFQAWEIKQAIASSAPPENIDVLVEELNIRKYFDALISGSELPGKPNPDIFVKAAYAVRTQPENCVVIEDSIAGVEGAKRAGMKCIAVTTTNPASALKRADFILDHLGKMSKDHFLSFLA